eukprot:TRINITY_DN12000_c2_g1_i2.p2 TRINITY_DN12000_c2_g1~~TRINITY_DN12000_c2_g1_i2.p2  ORF type:complete len:103 (-),score=17.70 TRINITY_DN12000_c2_g1_i2:28-336(-)
MTLRLLLFAARFSAKALAFSAAKRSLRLRFLRMPSGIPPLKVRGKAKQLRSCGVSSAHPQAGLENAFLHLEPAFASILCNAQAGCSEDDSISCIIVSRQIEH